MKRLLVLTAAIAVLTAANLRAAEERKVEGGKATAPVVTVNSGTVTLAGEGLNAAAGVWGGKSAAQWYIESIDKIVLLTDAQKKAITEAIEARDKAMQDFQAQNKENLQVAGKALGEAFRSQDKEKMAQAQKAYQDLYAPMHEAMKKSQKALDDILTPEQREKLQENRMATLIKTLTDPVQLSGEQLGKVKAAYREAAKKGEAEAMRALSETVQNGLTPEQKTTIAKYRGMNYAKGAFARAKLSQEQMKKVEAMVDELAKDPDPKMQWQIYGKLYEKINALLTPEQKEAMKAPFILSDLTKSGSGTATLGVAGGLGVRRPQHLTKSGSGTATLGSSGSGKVILLEGAKAEGGKSQPKPPDAGKPVEKPAEKKEPGATFKLNPVPGGGFQVIIGEGGKLEAGKLLLGSNSSDAGKPVENPAKRKEGGAGLVMSGTLTLSGVNVYSGVTDLTSPDACKPSDKPSEKMGADVSVQRLPNGDIQVTIHEAAKGKEGERREAVAALERARRSLEEAARSAKARMFEKVKCQHELAEQAWQVCQRLQSLGDDKGAEARALRQKLEAVEGQLRQTLGPAMGLGAGPAFGGGVPFPPGQPFPLNPAPGQPTPRYNPVPGQPFPFNPVPGQPPVPYNPVPGRPNVAYGVAPGQPPPADFQQRVEKMMADALAAQGG